MTRDYFFEFAGMPKSGKTTVCDIVVHFLKRKGLRVSEYHGGGRYVRIDKSSLTSLNLYLAIKAVEFVVTNVEREKTQYRVFVMDRGLFDRRVFTRTLLDLKRIDSSEASTISNFLGMPKLTDYIDGVFLFERALTSAWKENTRTSSSSAPGE